jgi:multidrug resistance efflux pump
VQKGQFVAELDKSALVDKLKQRENDLTKAESDFTQATLDTTLTLREARDQLVNLQFEMEQKKLELQQSAYEPPATIKQVQIALEKAERDYAQAKKNYEVKVAQSVAKVKSARATLTNEQNAVEFLRTLMNEFVITAPENGMLIYARDWDGVKKRQGSNISAWEPVVATLPDLSSMISKTYVNEVDIRKLKTGQNVRVGLDAFPDKKLTGVVSSVANMGEQKPNSDAKVFEVVIKVNETDTTLRPAMTTSNIIVASTEPDRLFVPLEAIRNKENITYVLKKEGIAYRKQEVKIGSINDQSVVILEGLTEQDYVMLAGAEDESEIVRLPSTK